MDLLDICYGKDTSIYDVLKINQDATPKEIQSAFMARRLELYQSMQSIDSGAERVIKGVNGEDVLITEKDFIEKKMDVLAAAFKVLRDPRKRRKYDSNLKRTPSKKRVKASTSESPTSIMDSDNKHLDQSLTNDLDQVQLTKSDDENGNDFEYSTPVKGESKSSSRNLKNNRSVSSMSMSVLTDAKAKSSSKSKKAKDKKVPIKNPSLDDKEDSCDEAVENYYKDLDVVERHKTGLGSWLRKNKYKSQASTVDTVATEIKGTVADICLSFSQVMTAFSVDEGAIDAMAKNIGDTSSQLSAGKYK